jgi:hypothetical protein
MVISCGKSRCPHWLENINCRRERIKFNPTKDVPPMLNKLAGLFAAFRDSRRLLLIAVVHSPTVINILPFAIS